MRLEGLHAVKHALRFGARLHSAVTDDPQALRRLTRALAPDIADQLDRLLTVLDRDTFRGLSPRPPATPLLATAHRPEVDPAAALARGTAPVVVLHQPRHAGNVGAVVRVAAAAEADAVLTTGELDPWSAPVLRAAAGLHWAVPVARIDWPPRTARPLVAFDPDGADYRPQSLPADALLVFGGERHGLPDPVLAAADTVVRLPMRAGVSSLNLATSVAAALYGWRLRGSR